MEGQLTKDKDFIDGIGRSLLLWPKNDNFGNIIGYLEGEV